MYSLDSDRITIAHGNGGLYSQKLIKKITSEYFSSGENLVMHDAAVVPGKAKIAYTTDSFVVNPIFFPGGDIGCLSVYGTANDLAMSGAIPKYLSCSFIIEEGFVMSDFERILSSMADASKNVGVNIVTGDTKVVERGKGDGIYINTSGIGFIEHSLEINPQSIKPGDKILVSGPIGQHGAAIMAKRHNFEVLSQLKSDCGSLSNVVQALLQEKIEIHCLRDLTRGGLVAALNELATDSNVQMDIRPDALSISTEVNSLCEVLGLDVLSLAGEGVFCLMVPESEAGRALDVMKGLEVSREATIIGEVKSASSPLVTAALPYGGSRILRMPVVSDLPRIC